MVGKQLPVGIASYLLRRARFDVPEEHFERLPKCYRGSSVGTFLVENNQEAVVPSLLEKQIRDKQLVQRQKVTKLISTSYILESG